MFFAAVKIECVIDEKDLKALCSRQDRELLFF